MNSSDSSSTTVSSAPSTSPSLSDVTNRAVKVMGDRILCGAGPDGEKRSRGGILIPATAASRDRLGVWADVVEVGPLVRTVTVGDKVLVLPDTVVEVDINGAEYAIVRERDVHAIASSEDDATGTGLYL